MSADSQWKNRRKKSGERLLWVNPHCDFFFFSWQNLEISVVHGTEHNSAGSVPAAYQKLNSVSGLIITSSEAESLPNSALITN